MNFILGTALLAAVVTVVLLWRHEREERLNKIAELKRVASDFQKFQERFQSIVDVQAEEKRIAEKIKLDRRVAERDCEILLENAAAECNHARSTLAADRQKINDYIKNAEKKKSDLSASIAALKIEFDALDEEAHILQVGFYKPHYDFADSERYQSKLDEIRERQKQMLKDKTAAVGDQEWHVNGSVKEGRKQINQTLKLMLRAFNGECDAAVSKVRYNNITVMETRIQKAFETVNGLADVQQCRITHDYLNLKLQELYLSHEYEQKVQAEKEEQRRIREQMKDEEIALREIEKAKQQAEEEERRYEVALLKAREEVERSAGAKQEKLKDQIAALELKLAEAHTNKERAISRAQMTRSGHVYVISNIGSFGENVYKIGMTRRLEPMDRIRELGDASVPFLFDVHAVIYSEDAPALEGALHQIFDNHRVNRVNDKKEFFNISIDQIVDAVKAQCGFNEIKRVADAEEFRKTVALRAQQSVIDGVTRPVPSA
jgi:hypothetical protein